MEIPARLRRLLLLLNGDLQFFIVDLEPQLEFLLYFYYVLLLLYLYLDVGGMVVCLQPRCPCASGAAVMRMLLLPLHPRPRRRRNGAADATLASPTTPIFYCTHCELPLSLNLCTSLWLQSGDMCLLCSVECWLEN